MTHTTFTLYESEPGVYTNTQTPLEEALLGDSRAITIYLIADIYTNSLYIYKQKRLDFHRSGAIDFEQDKNSMVILCSPAVYEEMNNIDMIRDVMNRFTI